MRRIGMTYLIGHNHKPSVSQAADIRVVFVMLQSHDLLDVLNFLVLHDLVMSSLSNVEELSSKGENTVTVASNNSKTGHCQCFGGVSFREDESTIPRVPGAGIVGIAELRKTKQSGRHIIRTGYRP
jgi:hypothetical protein